MSAGGPPRVRHWLGLGRHKLRIRTWCQPLEHPPRRQGPARVDGGTVPAHSASVPPCQASMTGYERRAQLVAVAVTGRFPLGALSSRVEMGVFECENAMFGCEQVLGDVGGSVHQKSSVVVSWCPAVGATGGHYRHWPTVSIWESVASECNSSHSPHTTYWLVSDPCGDRGSRADNVPDRARFGPCLYCAGFDTRRASG